MTIKCVALFLCVMYMGVINSLKVGAADYQVSAKVQAPISSQPAVILQPTNGTVFSDDRTVFSGTCPVLVPQLVVALWRGNTFLGSVVCSVDGTFAAEVGLVSGFNVVTPKILNITNDPGVDGSSVTVVYQQTAMQPQIPDNSGAPTPISQPELDSDAINSNETTQNVNEGAQPKIAIDEQFLVIDSNGILSFSFVIENGEAPYILNVDWGDGSSSTYRYTTSGRKTIKHTYSSQHKGAVLLRVTDKNGRQVSLLLGAINSVPFENLPREAVNSGLRLPIIPIIAGSLTAIAVLAGVVWFNSNHSVKPSPRSKQTKKRKKSVKK